MAAPISVQLYSVREQAAVDYEGTIRKIAAMGYVGVETAGFPGTTPEKAAALFKELNLIVSSAHTGIPLGEKKAEILETVQIIGSPYVITGFGPDNFKTIDLVKESCEKFNQANLICVENGLKFAIHNHWWEYLPLGDGYVIDYMLEFLDEGILFEVDTYWVQTAGYDPAEAVRKLGKRAPLLHIKDGPCERGVPQTAVGEGKVNFVEIVAAASKDLEWMIVELDGCATDMFEAVEKSYQYLTKNGLAYGK